MEIVAIVSVVVALVAVALCAWLFLQVRGADARAASARGSLEADARIALARAEQAERLASEAQAARDASGERVRQLSEHLAAANERLNAAEQRFQEERRLREQDEQRLREAFSSLSREALSANSRSFLELADKTLSEKQTAARAELESRTKAFETLVQPIRESLGQAEQRLVSLGAQLEQSGRLGDQLRKETERLSRALSRPEVRGRYGEIQLRRVVELAGMVSYCDFMEQASSNTDDGQLRPDLKVRLPNDRTILVDAKCNIDAYVQAASASDDAEREAHLERFARHVAEQAKKLSDKRYYEAFEGSPEFVVMFVPGDQFIDAALERRPELLDYAAEHRVILASPSTLIGLLRAVWVGWREQRVAEEARALLALGRELHDRAGVAFDHVSSLGKALDQAVRRYNSVVGSIDTRLVPTLRKFEETGARSGRELAELNQIEQSPRSLESAAETPGLPQPD